MYLIDSKKNNRKRCVVPVYMRRELLEEIHSGPLAGNFAGEKLYKGLVRHWWWPGLYSDIADYCANCPQCAIVNPSGLVNRPPLSYSGSECSSQIVGVDVMDLPKTEAGNKHVVVFQDFLSKWPLVFPVPDQKAIRLARLLAEEVVPHHSLVSRRHSSLTEGLIYCHMSCRISPRYWVFASSTRPPTIHSAMGW